MQSTCGHSGTPAAPLLATTASRHAMLSRCSSIGSRDKTSEPEREPFWMCPIQTTTLASWWAYSSISIPNSCRG